jgi:hypothetical protein
MKQISFLSTLNVLIYWAKIQVDTKGKAREVVSFSHSPLEIEMYGTTNVCLVWV